MSASITTTISVKDKATQEYKKIHQELLKYQEVHKKVIKEVDKDNTEMAKSEQHLSRELSNATEAKKKALRELAEAKSLYTKEDRKKAREEIENARQTLKNTTATEEARVNATKTLMEKEASFVRSHYDNLIALRKEELNKTKKINNEKRKLNQNFIALHEGNIKIAETSLSAIQKEEEALKKKKKETDLVTKSQSNLTNSVVRHLRQIETLIVTYYMLTQAWEKTLGKGLEVNKIIESNTMGIAALISANTENVDSLGNVLTPMEKFAKGQEKAKNILAELRKESVKTYATFPQLIEIYQQAQGQVLSMGDAFGTAVDKINKNTIKLASRMSNLAGSIGMPMDRVREEMRSLLSANASTDSLISTMLFGSPTQANKAITEAKKRTNGITELMERMLQPFDILAETKTYQKGILTLQNAWETAMADMVKDSGMFQDITDAFYGMSDVLINNMDDIVGSFDSFYESAKKVVSVLDEIALAVAGFFVAKKLLPLFTSLTTQLVSYDTITKRAVVSTKAFTASLKALALANAPLIALAGTIEALTFAYKNYNELKETQEKYAKGVQEGHFDREKELETVEGLKNALIKLSQVENGSAEFLKAREISYENISKKISDILSKEQTLSSSNALGELIQSQQIDTKLLVEIQKELNSEKSKLQQWEELRAKAIEEINKEEKARLIIAKDEQKLKLLDASIQSYKNELSKIDLEIAKEKQKISEKEAKAREKELEEKYKLNVAEIELANAIRTISGEKVTQKELLENEIANLTEKLSITSDEKKQKEILKDIVLASIKYENELLSIQEQKNKKIEDEAKAREKIVKDFTEFSIKVDTSGLDDFGKSLYTVRDVLSEIGKEQELYNKAIVASKDDAEKLSEIEKKHQENQLSGYGNIAGAMSQMFEEGSREAAIFQSIQSGLAVVEATKAILTQGSGDPYTAFARMAMMAASVSSLLSNVGIAFGSNKTTISSDAFSAQAENLGTGTVLGDVSKASESMTNSLETLSDYAKPEFQLLSQMNDSLISIDEKMGGVTSLLLQTGGFAFGEGFTGYNTGYQNNISLGSNAGVLGIAGGSGLAAGLGYMPQLAGASIGMTALAGTGWGLALVALDKLLLGGALTNLVGGVLNSVLGGLFGKTSVSQDLTDYGINFNSVLLQNAIEAIEGQAYQTITTTVTKKSWFSKSTSTSVQTYFGELDNEIERQFSMVLANLYNTTVLAGEALDTSSSEIENSLANFVVSIGKISLKGKTSDEIQEQITNIFSAIGDDIAETAFPELVAFQQVGEGMFDTLIRVAVGMEEAEYYISRLGQSFEDIKYTDILNTQGDVGFEALAQSIIKTDEAIYGLNNGVVQMIDVMSSTAEELYATYLSFGNIRDILVATNHSASDLSSSMILGAGSVSELESATESYMENFLTDSERLNVEMSRMTASFASAGYVMPSTRDAFIDLINSIDTTTDEGAEAYGRLIGLSEEFNDVLETMEDNVGDLTTSLETDISTIEDILSSLTDVIARLRGESETSENALAKFRTSMQESIALSTTTDYEAYQTSLSKTIEYVDALFNTNNFNSMYDMQFAQARAASQFESMSYTMLTEKDILSQIEENTSAQTELINELIATQNMTNDELISALRVMYLGTGSFDVGTTNLPNDMTARVHRGEGIIPKTWNQGIQAGDIIVGDTKSILKEVSNKNNDIVGVLIKIASILTEGNRRQVNIEGILSDIEEAIA